MGRWDVLVGHEEEINKRNQNKQGINMTILAVRTVWSQNLCILAVHTQFALSFTWDFSYSPINAYLIRLLHVEDCTNWRSNNILQVHVTVIAEGGQCQIMRSLSFQVDSEM